MFRLTKAHKDWQQDGIDCHETRGFEEMWRLKISSYSEAQLFAKPVGLDNRPDGYERPWLLVFNNADDVSAYWHLEDHDAQELLTSSRLTAIKIMAKTLVGFNNHE